MLLSRIIPCLLIKDKGLVKRVNFGSPKYVGDPINAVRIFNEKQVDELIVLDIDATTGNRVKLARRIGNQSIVIILDVKKTKDNYTVWIHNGRINTGLCPIQLAGAMESHGAGEIVINSIDNDGSMNGYDYKIINQVRNAVRTPITAFGGAGSLQDIAELIDRYGLIGAAAGSFFVFKGIYRAVLINYPSQPGRKG